MFICYESAFIILATQASYIDYVKFGWGTSLVSDCLEEKIGCLKLNNVAFFFGGTLFEQFLLQKKVTDYYHFCLQHGCQHVEISNGTIPLSNRDKASFIGDFAHEFTVFSEVGYKDQKRSRELHPSRWIEYIEEDLQAGAAMVITEARESGTSGICRENGELRHDLIEELIETIFEAPNKQLQTYFIRKFGTNVK
ncbi:(2R)-phospho-3-sulfolactate synthase ComA [Caldalkalibacillus thermarum TA2.A1]|uniref:(2R)-phospho-3-sulfolactate synthase ComA n=1 Tax=Caldalkalibacillus thermarum (strain TA2.A1) TaxID=986075 RepID=F5L8M6_CALTT|nr:phosphosulfolactate synthase [Caldalkalibacillus thermarum]EGL82265.1 (2R)-phospho-3-sulfolactate synthase ComA [Caldalkalibacillus thermarum TA2.A1]QZT33440.1 phosphosulfolactate synthase [Caldalkalibacillus thermarum TA2.A1]